jgi:hypothetical protein
LRARIHIFGFIGEQINANDAQHVGDEQQIAIAGQCDAVRIKNGPMKLHVCEDVRRAVEAVHVMSFFIVKISRLPRSTKSFKS